MTPAKNAASPRRPAPVCTCPRDSVTGGWTYDERGKAIVDPYCPIHGERAMLEFGRAIANHEESER